MSDEKDAIVAERTRAVVMAIAVLSLVATVVGLVYGRKLSPREISPYDSYGRGPLGTRVVVETLPRLGIAATRETDVHRVETTDKTVLFLAPEGPSQDIDGRIVTLADLIERRAERGARSIVVLPKWELSPFGVARPLGDDAVAAIADATGLDLAIAHVGRRTDRPKARALTTSNLAVTNVEVPFPQLVTGGAVELASVPEGQFVVESLDGLVVLVSDSDLVSNFSVHRSEHAALLVAILRSFGESSVVVDETFHGRHKNKSLAEVLGEWPGVLLLVQGAIVVAAVLLAGRKRFGRPRAVAEAYGRGPREAIAVAADVLTLGRAPTRLATRYVELMIRDVHRRLGLHAEGHAIDASVAADALDRLAEQRKVEVNAGELLRDARSLGVTTTKKRDALRRAIELALRGYSLRRAWLGTERAVGGRS